MPHRSLSPKGMRILLGSITVISLLIGLRFWLIGAWPVAIFTVVEVSMVMLLMVINIRRARSSETVRLTDAAVHVTRTTPTGTLAEIVLPSAWLRVELEERSGRVPRLLLRTPAAREEIASAIGETEKRDLAGTLGSALHAVRNPSFDNPQLRS